MRSGKPSCPHLTCLGLAAEDTVLIFDVDLVELIAKLAPKLHTVKTFIVLTERGCMHKAVSIFLLS